MFNLNAIIKGCKPAKNSILNKTRKYLNSNIQKRQLEDLFKLSNNFARKIKTRESF